MKTREEVLESIGLSKNESKVYTTLLKIGFSAVGKIAEESKVHRTNVYDALERLIEKGLVAFVLKDGKKYFKASDPRNLVGVVKEKEDYLNEILPQLLLDQQLATEGSWAQLYEGLPAAKNMLNHFLDLKKTRYVYGVPKTASKLLGSFLIHYHKKRIKMRLEMKHIYNSDAKERIKFLNSLPYTESRYLPAEYDSPVATSVCDDEVVLILWKENPLIIQIKNEKIANAYKHYFDLMWNIAKNEL